jgi:CheY-like chemotaxis protein
VGENTTFRVFLPPASAALPVAAVPIDGKFSQTHGARVLVVDDEEVLLRLIKQILEKYYDVVCATSASAALALIKSGARFEIIVCDLMMPEMTGMKFYETLLSQHPDLARRTIFMTGGATTASAGDFLRSVPNIRLEKPFTRNRLLEAVQQFLMAQEAIVETAMLAETDSAAAYPR